MKNENVKQVLTIISDKLPEDKLMLFKQRLESASDDLVDEIICTELHNPTFILLFLSFRRLGSRPLFDRRYRFGYWKIIAWMVFLWIMADNRYIFPLYEYTIFTYTYKDLL